MASPSGELGVGGFSSRAEGDQGRQQQGAVRGHGQDRLFGYRDFVPQLGLAHAQGVLFFVVIILDLPAIEVDLEKGMGRTGQVGG